MPAARVQAADLQFGPSNQGVISFQTSGNTATFDIDGLSGAILWRDNVVTTPASAKNKMHLSSTNVLTLYKQNGSTTGLTLDAENNRITLLGSSGGIYFGSNTTPTLTAGAGGKAMFGSGLEVSSSQLSVTTTTAPSDSVTGALVVAGGIGVAKDSFINGLKIGRGAGNFNTNATLGVNALNNGANIGTSIVAIGYNSLAANTTGYSNTGLGAYTLTANTGGIGNTAVGTAALYLLDGGSHNTAVGQKALGEGVLMWYNTAMGSGALYKNTGNGNSAYGTGSLGENTSGTSNVGLGGSALRANVNGWLNVGVGTSAGELNTSGNFNVFVGAEAGRYQAGGTNPLTTASNSIYIGYQVKGGANSDNNSIVIGTGAVGAGANTTVIGNSSTTHTHLKGKTMSPSLEVAGVAEFKGQVILTAPQGDIPMFTGY